MEKVQALVKKSVVRHENEPLNITKSIGTTTASKENTAASILNQADNALNMSKENGRNIVMIV